MPRSFTDHSKQYIVTYGKEHYTRIALRLRSDSDLPQRVQQAADAADLSVNAWITRAIARALEEEEKETD